MMIEITAEWIRSPVSVERAVLEAYRRIVGGNQEWGHFVSEHLKSVIDDGGVLFQRVQNPKSIREVVNPGGMIGYQYDLADVELWYLPRCSFEQSLNLLDVFGFPGEGICRDPQRVRGLTKELLGDASRIRRVALTLIRAEFIMVESVDPDGRFSFKEIDRVLDLNEQHFGIQYDRAELEDMRSHYAKNGFFVLGQG